MNSAHDDVDDDIRIEPTMGHNALLIYNKRPETFYMPSLTDTDGHTKVFGQGLWQQEEEENLPHLQEILSCETSYNCQSPSSTGHTADCAHICTFGGIGFSNLGVRATFS